MRIVFAGTPEYAAVQLEALINSQHKVVGVLTKPDQRQGRGRKLQSSAVASVADKHQIPCLKPSFLKDPHLQLQLAQFECEMIFVAAYGKIFPKWLLELPKYGCINSHASLLPRWRGASPIHHALLAGDDETGVCFMQMDPGLDTGAVLASFKVQITEQDDTGSLTMKLAQIAAKQLPVFLDNFDDYVPTAQNDENATYAPMLDKNSQLIDWNASAIAIHRQIRALSPKPLAHSFFDISKMQFVQLEQKHTLRIKLSLSKSISANMVNKLLEQKSSPGSVVVLEKSNVFVRCADDWLELIQVQLPGKTLTNATQSFVNLLERNRANKLI